MTDIHHPDTTARDVARQVMICAMKDLTAEHIAQLCLTREERDRPGFAADVADWIRSATTEIAFPGICAAQVRYMQNHDAFGPDGWTWCEVIDGEVDDFTLPRCADQADAIAQAAAWLGKQKRVDPAFPAPVVEARTEESA